jgi:hypothetical protein
MKRNISLLIIIAIMGFTSCNDSNDIAKDVLVKGIISDSITGNPIPDARVTLLGWRSVGEEETYDKIDTTTNNEGRFAAKFEEAFKVDIGSVAPNYHPAVKEIKDLSNASNIDLKLSRNKATGVLKDLGQMAVFARDYDISPSTSRTYHGINLLNGTNTQSFDSIDVGIEKYSGTDYPKTLITSEAGGVVPIFNKSKDAIIRAPETGYVNRYELNGKEKGFFVRCRDGRTYARLMIFSPEYDRSSQYKNGSVKNYGIMFNVELQTEGSEFNSAKDMRLDHYILGNL